MKRQLLWSVNCGDVSTVMMCQLWWSANCDEAWTRVSCFSLLQSAKARAYACPYNRWFILIDLCSWSRGLNFYLSTSGAAAVNNSCAVIYLMSAVGEDKGRIYQANLDARERPSSFIYCHVESPCTLRPLPTLQNTLIFHWSRKQLAQNNPELLYHFDQVRLCIIQNINSIKSAAIDVIKLPTVLLFISRVIYVHYIKVNKSVRVLFYSVITMFCICVMKHSRILEQILKTPGTC